MRKEYIATLAPLRGLAAVWVVIYHFDEVTSFTGLPYLIPRNHSMILGKGYLWVDLFFILSGFVITHVYASKLKISKLETIKSFIKARFARLYPLHLLQLLIHLILFGSLLAWAPKIASEFSFLYPWEGLWLHLIFGETFGNPNGLSWNPPAWSIGAEWWTYLMAIPTFMWLHRKRKWTMILLTLVGVGLLVLIPEWHEKGNLDTTWEFGLFRCMAEFSLGILLYQAFKSEVAKLILEKDVIGIGFISIVIIAMHLAVNDLVIVMLFAFIILSLAYNRGMLHWVASNAVPRFFGDISFSLYMFQAVWLFIYWIGMQYWLEMHPKNAPGSLVLLLSLGGVLLCNIVCAWVSFKYFEQPARNWIRSLSFKKLKSWTGLVIKK